jgi:hypothetical protein
VYLDELYSVSKSIFTGEPQIVASNDLGVRESSGGPNRNARHPEPNPIAGKPQRNLVGREAATLKQLPPEIPLYLAHMRSNKLSIPHLPPSSFFIGQPVWAFHEV